MYTTRSMLCSYVVAVTMLFGHAALAMQTGPTDRSYEFPLVQPARRIPDAPPAPPPALPLAADLITPATFDLVMRQGSEGRPPIARRQVSRTAERIHVLLDKNREWLFVRNRLDPRRVSGELIDHRNRIIVHHDESDLRNLVGLNGWVDVLSMGIGPDALAALEPTDQRRTVDGITFERYVDKARRLWWSNQEALALSLELRDGPKRLHASVERLRRRVDETVLRAPASRFPSYNRLDVAEWLERR